ALDRHYSDGAPPGWESDYVSSYATMHPADTAPTPAATAPRSTTLRDTVHCCFAMRRSAA
ncbi:hypothetical protein GV794_27930, partial [Nocardia cyriacigeorgica]